jgi:sugar phosphate isomerase/epimerase
MQTTPPLAISIAGLQRDPRAPWATPRGDVDARAAIAWVASLGVPSIQLDASLDGIRPRQLDRSARRDLAATLRRHGLALAGVDLWIPPEHFTDAARVARALDATLAAVELASELAPLAAPAGFSSVSNAVVSVVLPADLADDLRIQLEAGATRCGVRLADHRLGAIDPAESPAFGRGLDPATALLGGADPVRLASARPKLLAARLSDASVIARSAVGDPGARLDVVAYRVALETAGYAASVPIDLRGLPDQADAARRAIERWSTNPQR